LGNQGGGGEGATVIGKRGRRESRKGKDPPQKTKKPHKSGRRGGGGKKGISKRGRGLLSSLRETPPEPKCPQPEERKKKREGREGGAVPFNRRKRGKKNRGEEEKPVGR